MRIPEAGELLDGINRWTAIESKSDEPAGIAAMMAEAERDFRAAGLRTERIPGRDGFRVIIKKNSKRRA